MPRVHRCPTGFASLVRDGDWVVRGVAGTLDDDTHARALADIVAELHRSQRSSERTVVLVDLVAANAPTTLEHARVQRFHDLHGRLLRQHTAAIAFVAIRPLLLPPPCRWRAFTERTSAIAWLEQQAETNGMRGLSRRLRAALTSEPATQDAR